MFNTRTGSSNKFIFLSQKCQKFQIPKIEIRPCFNTLGPKFIFRPKIRGFIVKSCHLNYRASIPDFDRRIHILIKIQLFKCPQFCAFLFEAKIWILSPKIQIFKAFKV